MKNKNTIVNENNEGKHLGVNELSRFVKYPKIPYVEESPELLGREGYVFEKIDGSLSQIRNINGEIIGGSRANYLVGEVVGRSPWFSRFLKWMYSNNFLHNLRPGLIMFGEWLEPVNIKGYDFHNLDKFYFIDLAAIENGNPVFFDYEEAASYLRDWGIENIEILPSLGKALFTEQSIGELVANKRSQLGDVEMEGVVLKNYVLQKFAKFLHPKHSEIRRQAKTLESKYVTQSRVNKAIRRLKDEKDIKNPSLEYVVLEVASDIHGEADIIFDNDAVRSVIRAKNYYSLK